MHDEGLRKTSVNGTRTPAVSTYTMAVVTSSTEARPRSRYPIAAYTYVGSTVCTLLLHTGNAINTDAAPQKARNAATWQPGWCVGQARFTTALRRKRVQGQPDHEM